MNRVLAGSGALTSFVLGSSRKVRAKSVFDDFESKEKALLSRYVDANFTRAEFDVFLAASQRPFVSDRELIRQCEDALVGKASDSSEPSRKTLVHEAGHLVVLEALYTTGRLNWRPLVCAVDGRPGLRGYTRWVEEETLHESDKDKTRAKITFALAGHAAEAVYFHLGRAHLQRVLKRNTTDIQLIHKLLSDMENVTKEEIILEQWDEAMKIIKTRLSRHRSLLLELEKKKWLCLIE